MNTGLSRHVGYAGLSLVLLATAALADHHLLELANDIEPDDVMTGTLGSGNDANFYYLVRIPESGLLRAYTQGGLDTYGELLFTDNDNPILTANDGAEGGNFLIESRVTARDYIIRVAGATPFVAGAFNIVTEFTGDSEPAQSDLYTDQESAALVIAAGGNPGAAAISIGSFLEGDATRRKTFSIGDRVVVEGTVRPDNADIGKPAELFMVLRSNLNTWSYRDLDGNFQPWNISLKSLDPAYTVDSLGESETMALYSGELVAGDHRIFIGYMVDGGPLIFNGIAYRFDVE